MLCPYPCGTNQYDRYLGVNKMLLGVEALGRRPSADCV